MFVRHLTYSSGFLLAALFLPLAMDFTLPNAVMVGLLAINLVLRLPKGRVSWAIRVGTFLILGFVLSAHTPFPIQGLSLKLSSSEIAPTVEFKEKLPGDRQRVQSHTLYFTDSGAKTVSFSLLTDLPPEARGQMVAVIGGRSGDAILSKLRLNSSVLGFDVPVTQISPNQGLLSHLWVKPDFVRVEARPGKIHLHSKADAAPFLYIKPSIFQRVEPGHFSTIRGIWLATYLGLLVLIWLLRHWQQSQNAHRQQTLGFWDQRKTEGHHPPYRAR